MQCTPIPAFCFKFSALSFLLFPFRGGWVEAGMDYDVRIKVISRIRIVLKITYYAMNPNPGFLL